MIYRNLIKYHFFSDLSIYFILQAFMFVIIQYKYIFKKKLELPIGAAAGIGA